MKILFLLLILLPIIGLAPKVGAVDIISPICQTTTDPSVCQDNAAAETENPLTGPNGILKRALNILSILIGIISVIVVLLSGMRFITANGDPQAIATARQSILFAVIGLVIAAISQIIVQFVLTRGIV